MTQAEREAVVDLLTYAMYADRSLSLSEDKAFNAEISRMSWAGTLAAEDYVNRAISRVRAVRRHTLEEDDFLASRSRKLLSEASRDRLLAAIEAVTLADGDEAGDERTLKQRLRDLLRGADR